MKFLLPLLAVAFSAESQAKPLHPTLDPDPTASTQVDFETRAVVQIEPFLDSLHRSCTAIQIEEKIFLMAGHCAGYFQKSVAIPTWRNRSVNFKLVAALRMPSLDKSKEGTPDEKVDPSHELGLALIQPVHCEALREKEKFIQPLSKAPGAVAVDQKAQLATYGGRGIQYRGEKDGSAQFGPRDEEEDRSLQTINVELFSCPSGQTKCKPTQEFVQTFQQSRSTLHTVAKRTVEISETPVVREMTTHREGTVFLNGDSGAVLVQKDKSGDPVITGVLSGTGMSVENAIVTVLQDGERPIEFRVKNPESGWADSSKSALDFPSVQSELQRLGLKGRKFEIRRSYDLRVANFFSPLADPENQKFLETALSDLRQRRDSGEGCGRSTASKKKD